MYVCRRSVAPAYLEIVNQIHMNELRYRYKDNFCGCL